MTGFPEFKGNLKPAREKAEEGLDKAAEATGKFLKQVGDRIEEQAGKPVATAEEPGAGYRPGVLEMGSVRRCQFGVLD